MVSKSLRVIQRVCNPILVETPRYFSAVIMGDIWSLALVNLVDDYMKEKNLNRTIGKTWKEGYQRVQPGKILDLPKQDFSLVSMRFMSI